METIVQDFKLKYKDAALAVEEQTGISHLFILAQAALESGWGQHAPRNMFFGVKPRATVAKLTDSYCSPPRYSAHRLL